VKIAVFPPGNRKDYGADIAPPQDVSASGGTTITTQDEGVTLSSAVTTLNFVGAGVTASGAGATTTVTIPAGGSTITVKDEGVTKSTTVDTLDFVGANVTASGAGSTATITASGVQSVASADGSITVTNPTTTVDLSANVFPPSMVQGNLSQRALSFMTGYNTTRDIHGFTISILGSFTNDSRGRSTTDPLTVTRRTNLLSTTGLNTGAGFTCNSGVHFFRGTASWGGGFEMFLGCGVEAVNSDSRLCIGLTPAGGIIGGSTTEPSSASSFTAAGGFFIGYDSTDTNIQVISNNTTTTGTKVDTGLARLTTAQWLKVWIWADANASGISVRLEKVTTSGTSTYSGTITSPIPANTVSLNPTACLNTGPTTTTAVRFAFNTLICLHYKP
jgi:hypothetical protein